MSANQYMLKHQKDELELQVFVLCMPYAGDMHYKSFRAIQSILNGESKKFQQYREQKKRRSKKFNAHMDRLGDRAAAMQKSRFPKGRKHYHCWSDQEFLHTERKLRKSKRRRGIG